MAITILKQPQLLSPVYNDIIMVATSSNADKDGFLINAEVYTGSDYISTLKIPINPDGYAVIDAHRHIQYTVSNDFDPTTYDWKVATYSFVNYTVKLKEEYVPEWEFLDNMNSGGFLTFYSNDAHVFSVGDEVSIQQDPGYDYPEYNGICNITEVSLETYKMIKTDKPFIATSSSDKPGVMKLSKYRTYTSDVLQTLGPYDAFNGVLDFVDYLNWDYTEYNANTDEPASWLTNMPDNYTVKLDSNMWFNAYQSDRIHLKRLYILNSDGDEFYLRASVSDHYMSVGVGPNQIAEMDLDVASGSTPVIKSTTEWYTVRAENNSGDVVIAPKKIYIDRCSSRYEPIELVFMDKKGSFISHTFDMVSRNNKEIEKSLYQTNYGSYASSANNWEYNTYDRGITVLDTTVTEKWTLNSNWLNETDSDFLMELFQSPDVYMRLNGDFLAVILTVKNVEKKKVANDNLINYTVTLDLAVKNKQQLG